jgi:hypothetical protein
MTTRRWMIAVAVVGLILGGSAMVERVVRFHRLAYWYRIAEEINRGDRVVLPGGISVQSGGSKPLAGYYAGLWRKYEHAARYPWLPVEPDPPEPE